MSNIDRAFIKAFGQQESAEAIGQACSCQAGGTCAQSGDATCPCSADGTQLHEPPSQDETAAPPPVEPAGEAVLPNDKPFQPAFQVDSFAWPGGCARLGMVARDEIEQLADAMVAGREAGEQVVAISGCRRGDGCTTLLLCVARRLAERGLHVALVDADFDNPLLARRLGLLPDAGWEEVLAARAAINDVIIESIQDRLAVLPLCGAPPCQKCPAKGLPDPPSSLNVLREHYDLVLVDLGQFGDGPAPDDGASRAVIRWIDAVVLVRDVRTTPQAELDRIRRRVQAAGLAEAGIAENFVEVRKSA